MLQLVCTSRYIILVFIFHTTLLSNFYLQEFLFTFLVTSKGKIVWKHGPYAELMLRTKLYCYYITTSVQSTT